MSKSLILDLFHRKKYQFLWLCMDTELSLPRPPPAHKDRGNRQEHHPREYTSFLSLPPHSNLQEAEFFL